MTRAGSPGSRFRPAAGRGTRRPWYPARRTVQRTASRPEDALPEIGFGPSASQHNVRLRVCPYRIVSDPFGAVFVAPIWSAVESDWRIAHAPFFWRIEGQERLANGVGRNHVGLPHGAFKTVLNLLLVQIFHLVKGPVEVRDLAHKVYHNLTCPQASLAMALPAGESSSEEHSLPKSALP